MWLERAQRKAGLEVTGGIHRLCLSLANRAAAIGRLDAAWSRPEVPGIEPGSGQAHAGSGWCPTSARLNGADGESASSKGVSWAFP